MSVCICGGMCLSGVQEDICVCFVVPLRNDVLCLFSLTQVSVNILNKILFYSYNTSAAETCAKCMKSKRCLIVWLFFPLLYHQE